MELMAASRQWANRPADERFWTLQEMLEVTRQAAMHGQSVQTSIANCRIVNKNDDLVLETEDKTYGFNNWSFGQFCRRVGAPDSYIQSLPADIATNALNYNIEQNGGLPANIWFDERNNVARAITSNSYKRIFNYEIIEALINLPGDWTTPPAMAIDSNDPRNRRATAEDCRSSTLIKVGDLIGPAGLYASDRDMFAFRVCPGSRINDGSEHGLSRGFFIRNSEVGNASFEIVKFMYRYVCGNHIVWGASNVEKLSIRHIGSANNRAFGALGNQLKSYTEKSALDDEAMINRLRNTNIADNYEDLEDELFRRQKLANKKDIKNAYKLGEEYEDIDGNPLTYWGFAQAMTRLSQLEEHADSRNKLDMAAGKLLNILN